LNNTFFLFFALGILIDGSERLIRRRHGPRAQEALMLWPQATTGKVGRPSKENNFST
jgi:hypothetical protein